MPDAFDKLQEVSANETITAEAWNHLITRSRRSTRNWTRSSYNDRAGS